MQSLSIFSSKWGFIAATHLDSEMGSAHMVRRRRRKKRWGISDTFSCKYSCHPLSSFVLFSEPKRSFFSASFALAWALEEKLTMDGPEKDSLQSNESEGEDVSTDILNQVENNGIELTEEEAPSIEVWNRKGRKSGRGLDSGSSASVDVRALAQSLWSANSANDVEAVLKDCGELPPQVYSSMLKGFGIEKRLDCAFALVDWLKRKRNGSGGFVGPNLFIYNSLLGALKQSEQFGEVDKVMEDMAEQQIQPNIVTYNSLMSIYLKQGRPSEALIVLTKIEEKGLHPSPVTYSTVLLAYRRMENASGALRFFVELRDKYEKGEIHKDVNENWKNEFAKLKNFTIRICYQVMRQWLVKGDNQTHSIRKLLSEMDEAQLSPSRTDYEKLIWACTGENHYVIAKELYKRIRETENEISLSVCNHAIWLMGKAKKWWAALEVYEDLLDKGPEPNNLTYELIISHFNILLSAASKRGIWRWGVRLLNRMEEKGLRPGAREWNAVLVACSKASETSAAVQIFKRMVERGEKPTILSYGALLSALEKGKLYDEALQVWEHMCKMGIEPNLYAYTILASIHSGNGSPEQVDSVIREMVSMGIEPTVVTFNAIISGCARNGKGSAAFEWFHRMKLRNITPNEITYEMLIEALAQDAKPRLAYEIYLRAQNAGLHLSLKAYDAVVGSCQTYGASVDLSTLGPQPPEKWKIVKIRKNFTEFCNLADVPRRGKPFDREELCNS